jgi:hypothetical protein
MSRITIYLLLVEEMWIAGHNPYDVCNVVVHMLFQMVIDFGGPKE